MCVRSWLRTNSQCCKIEPIFDNLRSATDRLGVANKTSSIAIDHWLSDIKLQWKFDLINRQIEATQNNKKTVRRNVSINLNIQI